MDKSKIRSDLQKKEVSEQTETKVKQTRSQSEEKIKKLLEAQQSREQKAIKNHNQRLSNAETKTKNQIFKIDEQNMIALQKQKKEQNSKILTSDQQYRKKESGLKDQHHKEISRVHKDGDHQLFEQKGRIDFKKKQLTEKYKTELEGDKKNFFLTKKQQEASYYGLLDKNDTIFRKNLQEQKIGFKKQLEVNRAISEDIVQNQNRIFNRELVRQKSQFTKDISKYDNVDGDPFYQIPHFNAELIESNDRYTLQAHIPKHERDNVDVHVQKDKIVITGKREFKERIEDKDKGQLLQSSNFQSFRQEFKIDFPIYERAVVERYEDGVLTVTVPKLGANVAKVMTQE